MSNSSGNSSRGKKLVQSKEADVAPVEQLVMNNKNVFLLALSEGLGLTRACEVSGNDIIEVSNTITEFPDFKKECEKAIQTCINSHVMLLSAAMKEGKFMEAEVIRKSLNSLPKLVLWGQYSDMPEGKLVARQMLELFIKLRNGKETATAMAMTYDTYTDFVIKSKLNELVAKYVNEPML